MLRKLAIVVVIVFLGSASPSLQVLTALGIIMSAMIAQISARPYKHQRMNDLERLSLLATMVMLYCALFFVSDIPMVAKSVLGAVLMVFNLVVIAFLAYNIIYEFILGVIWKIDQHSNADGVLTWEDVWVYVEKVHSGKRYTPALVHCLRACESCTICCYNTVTWPVRSARAAGRYLRRGSRRMRSKSFRASSSVVVGARGSSRSAALLGNREGSISSAVAVGGGRGDGGSGGGDGSLSVRRGAQISSAVGADARSSRYTAVVPILLVPPVPERMDNAHSDLEIKSASIRPPQPPPRTAAAAVGIAAEAAPPLPGSGGDVTPTSWGPAGSGVDGNTEDVSMSPPLPMTSGRQTLSGLTAMVATALTPSGAGGHSSADPAATAAGGATASATASINFPPSSQQLTDGGGCRLPPPNGTSSRQSSRSSITFAAALGLRTGAIAPMVPPSSPPPPRRVSASAWPQADAGGREAPAPTGTAPTADAGRSTNGVNAAQ
ncbi:hypothetical protein Vafri_18108 [Volvox africanus]|nr:hypothetical protein Vafri_18108 [Volvox africanus]